MEDRSDYDLITDYLAGDESAFETLYHRYRKVLYAYVNGLLPGRQAEADEVFQLAWIKVVDQLKNYRDQGCFTAWICRIARNLLIDRVRKNKHIANMVELDREDVPPVSAPAGTEPWRDLDEADLGLAIRNALADLPREQREVFLMRSHGEMPFKEIAKVQQCSINTVLARMQYALKHLRASLGSLDQGGLVK
ncbi:MAG: sigma-70 family RNA polymerase sigma factor [Lentisphaeria bacterium]|nr:sigma-70 family RNA polymerase sigma factor [Lentisphaeria bacterium]MBQ7394364.1 sigma-70 family RNA polymerase sigma factor [Lentisphaeria bacterium]